MSSTLPSIFNRACEAIRAGNYEIKIINKDFTGTPQVDDIESAVLEWMLATKLKSLGNRKAIKADIDFIVIPKGVRFPAKDFTRRDLCFFASPQTEITWDKKVKLRNGVFKYYLFFPTVTIEYIPVKEAIGTIVIYPHEKYLNDVETDRHVEIVRNDMRIARSWLQKVLLCRLSYPVEVQEKHLARPILNPSVMRVLEKAGAIRIGDVWIDASKMGFEYGEIESTDPEKLRAMEMLQWSDMNIPLRVDQLEKDVSDIHVLFKKYDAVFDKEFDNSGGYIQ